MRVGIKAVIAENGQEGVDLVNNRTIDGEKPFDLIFMDIHMPVMDGLEAASLIANMNLKTPIVALTANIMASDRDVYRSHGINDLLAKPFTSQELWRCLLKYLKPIDKDDIIIEDIKPKDSIELKNEAMNQEIETTSFMDDFDEEIRMQLIADFQKEIQTLYSEITAAIGAGDITLARRLAHTLKGNSRLFNKERLREAAATVEHHLVEGKNTLSETHLKNLETELNVVLKDLEKLFT